MHSTMQCTMHDACTITSIFGCGDPLPLAKNKNKENLCRRSRGALGSLSLLYLGCEFVSGKCSTGKCI